MTECAANLVDRRKQFWTTQQCDTVEICGRSCGTFGLKFTTGFCNSGCDNVTPEGCTKHANRQISNSEWIKGLIINILMTDGARPNDQCGFAAGNRGGHWSSSYRKDNGNSGTNIRAIPAGRTTTENILALQVEAQKIADKIVGYGVVKSANAKISYLGGMVYSMLIEYVTKENETNKVGFSGARSGPSFVWE